MNDTTRPSVAGSLREALELLGRDVDGGNTLLAQLYDESVVFRDPLQTVHGLDAFLAMNRRLASRAREISFSVTDMAEGSSSVFMAWTMRYAPKVGPALHFEGTTHLKLRGGKVIEHRDYWDLLDSVTDTIPLVSRAYHGVVRHLA
jgi:limonene-1,2-epoxide hydrolase